MTPNHKAPGDFRIMCWAESATVHPAFDTTDDEIAEHGLLAFEDRVQIEAHHLKEDWQ